MARARRFSTAGLQDRLHLLEGLGRYTRFVRLSKITLLFLIIGMLGMVVALPVINKDTSGVRIALSSNQESPESVPMMKNPRFQGMDSQNQPYTVTADSALQQDLDTVLLKKVQADVTFKDKTWISIDADQGILKLSEENLVLIGNVNVFYEEGYEMHTESVSFELAEGLAYSDTPLEGQGKMGYIKAAGFTAHDRGARLEFKGPVKLVLYPEAK